MKGYKQNIALMLTGIAIGSTLMGGNSTMAADIMAELTWQNIYVDGRRANVTAYNIKGNNYVRLRDIGKEVGFNVYWQDGVQIDTAVPYTGETPVQNTKTVQSADMEIRLEMVGRINAVRREHGVPELKIDHALMDAAQTCSGYLLSQHNNRLECETIANAGYPHGFGSNLTVFTSAVDIAEHAVTNWENSPGHLKTMIDPRADSVRVGVAVDSSRTFCYMLTGMPNTINPHS